MTKVNKKSKAVRDKTGQQSQIQWCKLKLVTSKHETNMDYTFQGRKISSKEIAKAQNKDQ
jgi:hypothetical protein